MGSSSGQYMNLFQHFARRGFAHARWFRSGRRPPSKHGRIGKHRPHSPGRICSPPSSTCTSRTSTSSRCSCTVRRSRKPSTRNCICTMTSFVKSSCSSVRTEHDSRTIRGCSTKATRLCILLAGSGSPKSTSRGSRYWRYLPCMTCKSTA